ncbi:MAG: 16S rRNA (guanine(966)-N(2))-methyltransferase RsmD [Gammaproteobacteria bacterium]|nr:MAG: 16S rRNA (guanine(966)-N(2))-methyltransferase RsmD [Gammaproteobacteria bacterium]RLA54352.1 MAG: 16S rRNA (guanine(966)-N(2))-methyltransferase RsmD [Gammaproteobacteria bacterium]
MSQQPKHRPQSRQVRIIAGQWRGRRLNFPDTAGLRPTGDRVRETLFNWLMPELPGARCLDLFAGSGALGFEAASRLAASVIMVEKNHQACRALQQHCENLSASTVDVVCEDALTWLNQNRFSAQSFDIVFLDPPFKSALLAQALQSLEYGNWLTPHTLIYTESENGQQPTCFTSENWELYRQRVFGAVDFRLYRRR